MAQDETPQIYLITPPDFELSRFPTQLASVLDTHEIACVRLALASHDEDTLCRAADALREVTMARDVALVIERHILLVERLGLDGVHLTDGSRSVAKARKALGKMQLSAASALDRAMMAWPQAKQAQITSALDRLATPLWMMARRRNLISLTGGHK